MTKPQQPEKGLYDKYIVSKTSGKPLDPNFYAIVLRIDGGRYVDACREGAMAFARAVQSENPTLAEDIEAKVTAYRLLEIDLTGMKGDWDGRGR